MTYRRMLWPMLIAITFLLLALNYFGNVSTQEPVAAAGQHSADHRSAVADSGDNDDMQPSGPSSLRQASLGQAPFGQAAPGQDAADNPGSADSSAGAGDAAIRRPADSIPASDTSAATLSPRVYFVIEEAQRRQMADQWDAALTELNALYADFDSMSSFEQATLLNFYTNTLLRLEMWQASISAFTLMLTVDNLRPDSNARALLALGQLHQSIDEMAVASAYYAEWLEFTRGMPGLEEQTARVEQALSNLR